MEAGSECTSGSFNEESQASDSGKPRRQLQMVYCQTLLQDMTLTSSIDVFDLFDLIKIVKKGKKLFILFIYISQEVEVAVNLNCMKDEKL